MLPLPGKNVPSRAYDHNIIIMYLPKFKCVKYISYHVPICRLQYKWNIQLTMCTAFIVYLIIVGLNNILYAIIS